MLLVAVEAVVNGAWIGIDKVCVRSEKQLAVSSCEGVSALRVRCLFGLKL